MILARGATARARAAAWRTQDRHRQSLERNAAAALRGAVAEAIAATAGVPPEARGEAIAAAVRRLAATPFRRSLAAAVVAGMDALDQAARTARIAPTVKADPVAIASGAQTTAEGNALGIEARHRVDNTRRAQLRAAQLAARNQRVDAATQWLANRLNRDIDATVQQGLRENLSVDALTHEILKVSRDAAGHEAERIARTEIGAAYVSGGLAQARAISSETGVTLRKTWITTTDGHARATHTAADGQTVDLDDTFVVGLARLRYPGDERGPKNEVINCRCAMAYEPVEAREAAASAGERLPPRPSGLPPAAQRNAGEGRPLAPVPPDAPAWVRSLPAADAPAPSVLQAERIIAARSTERIVLFDADGRIIDHAEGTRRKVAVPGRARQAVGATHNHPWNESPDGSLGQRRWYNPLSVTVDRRLQVGGDLGVLAHYGWRYLRAVAPNGLIYEATVTPGKPLPGGAALAALVQRASTATHAAALAQAAEAKAAINLVQADLIWRWLADQGHLRYRVMRLGDDNKQAPARPRPQPAAQARRRVLPGAPKVLDDSGIYRLGVDHFRALREAPPIVVPDDPT